jgi:hypothetical protein
VNLIYLTTTLFAKYQIKAYEMGRARNMHGEKRILVGKLEGKRQLGSPRWEDIINIDFKVIKWDGMDWIHLVQDRNQWRAPMNTVMNIRVTYNSGKFLSS